MSLSDGGAPMLTMPVSPTNSGGGFGWGGDNGVWLIVLFLIFAVCGGWGNNGWGGGGGAMDNYVLASDFATLQRQIDSAASTIERKSDITQQGICDGFYAMNTGMLNGFAGVTQTVTSGFSQAEVARCNQQMAFMQQFSALQAQMSGCCCDLREAIQGINYNLATQGSETRNLIQGNTRDIIDAMNCGFRSIEQRLTAQEIAAKDAKIAEQNQRLFAADLAASHSAQTLDMRNYVSAQFAYYNPRPVPSFSVPAPYQYTGCGCNQGCGC
nr:MAG TPA: hypothetical protein [Caudoviricetes sp.]